LSWTAPTNNGGPLVTGYKIEEKVATGSFTVIVTNTGNTNASYSRTSLTTGTSYTYKVSAINSVGPSTTSNEASATPTPTSSITLPSPPTNLSATKVSQTQVNLSWNAPSDNGGSAITGYKIEEKVGTGSFTVIVANTGNTNTSYSRTGLTAGLTYTYKVSAINSAGTSSPSNEVTSSQTIIAVPNPPSNLVVASASPTQLNLSWKAPSDNGGPVVTGYKIEVKSGSNPYAILVSNTGSVTSYSHSGLTTGTTYTYKVSAINSVGIGAPSNEVSAKPIKTIVPTSLTAVATSPTQIRLTWFAPSETFGQTISGYKIERKISEGTFITIVDNTNSQTTTHSISGLTTGTTYTFLVSASYPLGASGQSNEASATPTSTSTAPPASPPPSSTPSTPSPPPQQTGTSPNQPGIQNSKSKSEYQEFLKIRKEMDALALEEDKIKHEIDLQFSKISRPLGKYSYISSLEKPLKRIMEELIANPSKVLIQGNKDSIVEVLHAVIKAVVAGNVSVKDTTKAVQQIEETINRLDEFLKMKSDLSQKRDSFENRLGIFNISELEEKEGELIKTRDKKRHAESVAKNLENAVNDVIMHIPQLGRDIEIKLKEISGTRITLKI
jgi:hypothetical protein